MILDQVKQICPGHIEKIVVQKLTAKCSHRRVDRGLQQSNIANARTSPMAANLLLMRLQNVFDRQEYAVHLFRQPLERLRVLVAHAFQRLAKTLSPLRVVDGLNNEATAVVSR